MFNNTHNSTICQSICNAIYNIEILPRARTARVIDMLGAISANGRLPATLPEPIKRARDKDLCGFAGEGNVVERSERYASEAKPEEPKG